MALVLTARKLVRLIDALLRNDQVYTPQRKVIDEVNTSSISFGNIQFLLSLLGLV